jgi:DNA (cytosine-5)-methyltransferase 1
MSHKEKLLDVNGRSSSIENISNIPSTYRTYIETIGEKVFSQKGVFTVLTTLLTHKLIDPKQDIRKHQSNMNGGFSGRSIDTTQITPTLKELGLPSMAESGWLTRSLEQPQPYTKDYRGSISNGKVKTAFLEILDFVQKDPNKTENILLLLLNKVNEIQKENIVQITPLKNPDGLTIAKLIKCLDEHFSFKYHDFGGAKLPVLAFYAIYKQLIQELKRYESSTLNKLGSHTASDRTSKTAGDIEIFKGEDLFEAIEIKDKEIDVNVVLIAIEKIERYNPTRYYILTHKRIKLSDEDAIDSYVKDVKAKHGCQIIINGVLPTIKYYLRLIYSIEEFFFEYSKLVEEDIELKKVHKVKWNDIIKEKLN